jgi:hypothetical protein
VAGNCCREVNNPALVCYQDRDHLALNATRYRYGQQHARVDPTRESPRMKVLATGKHRMNLSGIQMMAAAQFARKAGEIEQRHTGDEWGPSYDEITMYLISAI